MAKPPSVEEISMAIAVICDARAQDIAEAIRELPVSSRTVLFQMEHAESYNRRPHTAAESYNKRARKDQRL